MAKNTIQLGGVVEISLNDDTAATPLATGGWIDVSDWVQMATATKVRQSVTRPATFGQPQEEDVAGPGKDTVAFQFYDDLSADAFRSKLWDVIETDKAIMHFRIKYYDEAVGTDNPQFSGAAVVLGLDTGATAGELRSQSQTFSVLKPGIAKATS